MIWKVPQKDMILLNPSLDKNFETVSLNKDKNFETVYPVSVKGIYHEVTGHKSKTTRIQPNQAYKKHTGTQWTLPARIFRSLLWVPLEILLWGNDTVWVFRPQGKGLALQCDRALGWPLRENQPNREGSNSQFELYISVVPQTGHMTYKFKTETNEQPNV